ncbi:M23 family metallopeptidase [Sandaracinus amylolyticus]|uniref:M23 family metallopeptidase n=1 Tax=Sandaracinus amylolyticus TaxID=927083 RepID=UPI001F169447|nr:M23 family metallopeptidase [Sandaracinus amylolyticus]
MRLSCLVIVAGIVSVSMLVRADPDPADQARELVESATGDADLEDEHDHAPRRFDYSRFSDGPRRVPTPRGASKVRAEQLGLGTRECAHQLLHGRPLDAWVAASNGREPSRLLWPVDEGRWVRGYGYVRTTRPDLIHRGIDIAAEPGTVVRAAADGIVAYSDNEVRGYGNLVLIVHANGWVSLYAHNARTTVQPGYRVRRGERIALVGRTGIARGPHLHFELWHDGHAVNPAALFDGGPTFVQRLASRAAASGRVAPPEEVTAEDRPIEAPLPPHPDDVVVAVASAPPVAPSAPSEAPLRELDGLELGSLALARRLLSRAASDTMLSHVEGRVFSTLLFPVRDGTTARPFRSSRAPMQLAGAPDAAVRAAADGLVVFAGELPGRGPSIVLLHRNGWVTAYVGVGVLAAEVGTRVERGAWIARMGATPVELELRIGGIARDPGELLFTPTAPIP